MQNLLSRVGNPALRYGIMWGVILGIVLIGATFLGISNLSLFVPLILALVAGLLAGRQAGQKTGRIFTGALSGLWTGLIGSLILSLPIMILVLANVDAIRQSAQQYANSHNLHVTYTNSDIIVSYLVNYGLLLVLGVLFGLAGGAVGGMIGRNRWRPPSETEEYQEAMFEPPSRTSSKREE
jgi:hypothetical protein